MKNQTGFIALGPLAYGIIALGILTTVTGFVWGVYAKGKAQGKAEVQAKWDEANAAARKREAELSAFAAKALADERKKRKVVIQERTVYVDRNIEKLVDSGRCIKPDGVQCLNAAIGGQSAAGCKPDGAVRPAAPAG